VTSSTVGENFWGSKGRIRDGVWGDVPVDKAVRTLLDTAAMTRLKGISSLGFAHFAFPAARHTGFDHAVGVYHLTRLTLKRITDSGAYLEDRDVRGSLAAALLAEVGKYPYPWAVEGINLPGMVLRDEETRHVIEETEVAEVLRETWDLEPHNVFRLAARGAGEYDEGFGTGAPLHDLTPTEHLVRDLLSGALNLATLDYLVRDTRGAQLPFGNVDVGALINSLRIVGQDNRAILALDESGVGHLQSLVFARYLMHYNVYGHHALRIPTAMFLRAVQDAVQTEEISAGELIRQDDAGALALISRSAADPGGSSATLVRRLTERRPYKRALELDERHPSYASLIRLRDDASWRRRVEEAWARYLTRYRKGVAGSFDILIDLPENKRFDVGLRVILRSPGLAHGERNPVTWQGISGLSEEDMVRYHAPLHRIRIATATDDLATSVRRHADELFTIAEEVG
jgi:HD superfamily phosphohydrolase